MCTITEEIYREGITEGKIHTAKIMYSRGFCNAEIAEILEVDTEEVQNWLSSRSFSTSN